MAIRSKRGRGHWLVVAATLTVTLGAGVATEFGLTANADVKPAVATPSSSPSKSGGLAPGAHPTKFGLDYGSTLLSESPKQIRTSLQDAVDVGAKWIRVDLPWESVQPENASTYDWNRFDVVADAAHSLGLEIDAILDATAYWDTTPACKKGTHDTTMCPPADNADFARFASTAANRYQNRGVGAWEIWNEPNISGRWWPFPNAGDYVQLLGTVATAIRAADHNAFILMGGFAAVPDDAKRGYVSQATFLKSVVAIKGSLTNVGGISYHPFSAPVLPSKAGDYSTISAAPGNLLSILQASGNPGVQIWVTESGSSEYDGAIEPVGTAATAKQLLGQGAYATDLVKTASSNPSITADFWFADQDIPTQGLYWGLRDAGGRARPVFSALKSAIAACGCAVQ